MAEQFESNGRKKEGKTESSSGDDGVEAEVASMFPWAVSEGKRADIEMGYRPKGKDDDGN